jgi:ABC-type multidrug transport system fused ATPase/permease subunit
MIFAKYLNFHMGFFDRQENTSGALISKLSSDTTKINGIALSIVGQLFQTSVTLVLGVALSLVYDWRLCLINIGFLPLIIGSYILQFKVQKGGAAEDDAIEMEAGSILSESVINTKTIFSYNMEAKVVDYYSKILEGFNRNMKKSSMINGIFYSSSQFIVFGMYATLFYAGGQFFFMSPPLTLKIMMRAILTILFSALGVGVAAAFVGDYTSAKKAIVSLYDILDEPSLIDIIESEKNGIHKDKFIGKIEFRNVSFAYPTRPDFPVFKNLNFIIEPGQHVAFVGSSGSGKSTIISLIERFYDVTDGQILIDDVDIRQYNLKNLRLNIGLVSQEPALFKRSVRENIRYGRLNSTDEEIVEAANAAYISDLIDHQDLPVSGGQKQRIAIARAILKNPAILLLDEATSALDMEREQLVQKSLDNLMHLRTSIVVAHR